MSPSSPSSPERPLTAELRQWSQSFRTATPTRSEAGPSSMSSGEGSSSSPDPAEHPPADSFALRLPRAKLPRLAEELRAVPPERVAALQAGGRRVWERFTFSSLGLAEKRRMCGGTHFTAAADGCVPRLGAPGGKHSQAFLASSAITGQDAIATLLQLLRARLLERTSPERG